MLLFIGHSRSPISKNKKSVSPYQGGVSPDSPDKTSPNKIKPAQSSNFNPNAPSFVPMAALGTNIVSYNIYQYIYILYNTRLM